jgi:hypothetical protein
MYDNGRDGNEVGVKPVQKNSTKYIEKILSKHLEEYVIHYVGGLMKDSPMSSVRSPAWYSRVHCL